MGLDLTALADYVEQNRKPLIKSLVKSAKSASMLEIQAGFKYKGAINVFDTDAILQDGSSCGFNSVGTTSLEQRELEAPKVKVQESICPDELDKKWTMHLLNAGSNDDSIPFEEDWAKRKAEKVAYANELLIWQGDKDSVNGQLNKTDGLIKIIDSETDVIDGNTSRATAITSSNILEIVDDIYSSMPTEVLSSEDPFIACGWDFFRMYVMALKNANLFHYAADSANGEIIIPGTDIKLVALEGLTGTDRVFAGRKSGFVIGVDMENEYEDYRIWYDENEELVKISIKYKIGTQIKFPQEIVEFTLAV